MEGGRRIGLEATEIAVTRSHFKNWLTLLDYVGMICLSPQKGGAGKERQGGMKGSGWGCSTPATSSTPSRGRRYGTLVS